MNRRAFLKTFAKGSMALTTSGLILNTIGCGNDGENPLQPDDDVLFAYAVVDGDDDTTPIKYVVDESKCTGCGKCERSCPEDAITIIDDIANIDQDICVQCGTCFSVCPKGAIERELVEIELPSWDVNKDGKIDIFDLVLVGSHFGETYAEPGLHPPWDVNKDGKVDIFDLVLVGSHFGEVYEGA